MKKNLLQESELRKMMKLGGVKRTLVENFVAEKYQDETMYEMPEEEPDAELDMGEPEMEDPEGGEFEGTAGDVEGMIAAIADVLAAHTGVDIEVEGAGGMGDEMGMEEPEMDMGEPEMGPDDMGGEEEYEEEPALEETAQASGEHYKASPGSPSEGNPKGSKMPQLEENDELEESFADMINKPGPAGTKKKRKQHGGVEKPSIKGPLGESDLEEEQLDEMEQVDGAGGDPNKYTMQKEAVDRVARKVVEMLFEKLKAKKDE